MKYLILLLLIPTLYACKKDSNQPTQLYVLVKGSSYYTTGINYEVVGTLTPNASGNAQAYQANNFTTTDTTTLNMNEFNTGVNSGSYKFQIMVYQCDQTNQPTGNAIRNVAQTVQVQSGGTQTITVTP